MKNIVIIGSGLAGSILANLLKDDFTVTILEKGGDKITIPLKKFVSRKLGDSVTYCNGVGGTTNLWHNGLIKMPKLDEYTNFSKIIQNSEYYADKAAKCLKFPTSFLTERKKRLDEYQEMLNSIHIKHDLDTILIPKCDTKIVVDSNVKIYKNVAKINYLWGDYNNICSVEFTTTTGECTILNSDYILVCAGGIGSPTVISNILKNININITNSKLGVGFIDHPMGFVGKIKVKKEYRKIFKNFVNKNNGSYFSRCGLVVKEKEYSHICYFRPAYSTSNRIDIYKFKSFLGTSTLKEKIKCIFDKRLYHPDILLEILMHFTSIQFNNGVYSLWFVFEQKKANSNNTIVPSNDIDTIDWKINEGEQNNYLSSIQSIKKSLLPLIETINVVENNIDDYLWSAAHHSGSISFGNKPENIDENLRINGTSNVYVCDGSVIEQHSYANTGLTIAQLCYRLHEYLINKEKL
ncbi:GMC oxidoreductase [Photorhabdus namnaonensis]|uniref:Choline dehydrogenase n=1 Tax=Photorhabdus namnaonensis TaxID=1851568 RepID=A0A1B8YNG6_9GAMM|nr:GMC oxidoreductase [Photorhabdus namnaonensis]OCA56606.1 choline dehydrogenase [Photorhabdus namnaonensis]